MKYIAFLTNKQSQITWANATGYIPVNVNAAKSSQYLDNKAMKLPCVLAESMKHVTSIPAIKNANSAYNQASSSLEIILANAKKSNFDLNSQIKTADSKFSASWNQ